MNLVADEDVDRAIVERLRRDGHDVVYIAESSPSAPNEDVLQQANARGAVLKLMRERRHGTSLPRVRRGYCGRSTAARSTSQTRYVWSGAFAIDVAGR